MMTTPSSSPNGFDADAALAEMERQVAALERPEFRRGGRVYRGVILSADQWRRFEPRLFALFNGKLSDRQAASLIYAYAEATFPSATPLLWAGRLLSVALGLSPLVGASAWCVLAGLLLFAAGEVRAARSSVAWQVLRLPDSQQVKAVMSFLECQTPANELYRGQRTSGTDSPPAAGARQKA